MNSDETIIPCKGRPVCSDDERTTTTLGCRFVDEVVTGVPYIMDEQYVQSIIQQHRYSSSRLDHGQVSPNTPSCLCRIDYIVHGDDPCIVDGKNVYEAAIRLGIPTKMTPAAVNIPHQHTLWSHLLGKYLTIPRTEGISTTDIVGRILNLDQSPEERATSVSSCLQPKSHFLTTARMINLFGAGLKVLKD